MRAFPNSDRPGFRRDTSMPVSSSNQPAEALRLCDICNTIPENILSLELGYDHYPSIKLLRTSAGLKEYCHLCQMMWESIATKQRFNVDGDPMLLEDWPVKIYAVRGTERERWSWRGYTAIEFRSGDRSTSEDCTWSTAPTWSTPGVAGAAYPIVSRLYIHPGDQSNPLTYADADLNAESSSSMEQIQHWSNNCEVYHNHTDINAVTQLPTRVIDVDRYLTRPRLYVQGNATPHNMARYTALSYCWGTSKATTTTTQNLQLHVTYGFDFAALPKTIQDAITVTRSLSVCSTCGWTLCAYYKEVMPLQGMTGTSNHQRWPQSTATHTSRSLPQVQATATRAFSESATSSRRPRLAPMDSSTEKSGQHIGSWIRTSVYQRSTT